MIVLSQRLDEHHKERYLEKYIRRLWSDLKKMFGVISLTVVIICNYVMKVASNSVYSIILLLTWATENYLLVSYSNKRILSDRISLLDHFKEEMNSRRRKHVIL